MAPHKGPPSLTDSERFSSVGSNESSIHHKVDQKKNRPTSTMPASSRRRVGIADSGRESATPSARKVTSFHDEGPHRASYSSYTKNTKSFDDRSPPARQQQQLRQCRPSRKYIQESPPSETKKDSGIASSGPPRAARKYIQESNDSPPSSSSSSSRPQQKDRRQSHSSSLRSSTKIERTKESKTESNQDATAAANINALVAENKALEAERATIEKYKRMYEAILQDPGNAFLFESTGASIVDGDSTKEESDTFDAALNVKELIEGLKLKDLLHDSATQVVSASSESVSLLSEIRQGESTRSAAIDNLERSRPRSKKVGSSVGENLNDGGEGQQRVKPRMSSRKSGLDSSVKTRSDDAGNEQRVKSRSYHKRVGLDSSIKIHHADDVGGDQRRQRSGSKSGDLNSSIRSHRSDDDSGRQRGPRSSFHHSDDTGSEQRRPRSGSTGEGLGTSDKTRQCDDVNGEQRAKSRSNSKRGGFDSSIRSHESNSTPRSSEEPHQHRRSSQMRQSRDPNLTSSTTSHKSSRSDKDCVSVASNTSTGSRMGRFFGRISLASHADRSVADDLDYDGMTDVQEDVVPDLTSVNYEKKEKKGLFGKMKKFGKKVSKAFVPAGPAGFKKYKVGEVARYNIGKIRDSLESFDPSDPTVEVVIVAVHIDAVLEIPYYTIQLPDGSRKQTNMENLIPLEDYNNGTRPYARIKEKRSSSRRRSSRGDREDEDDDDRSTMSNQSSRSNRSTRSTQSSRSTRSSSSRGSSRHDHHDHDDRSTRSSSRHRDDDRNRKSSSESRRKDEDYRPRVDAMRGGGMASPDKGANLKRDEKPSKSKADGKEKDYEEPVIIKLTSRNSVGSSLALDAAVAAAVGVRRASAAASVNSSSYSYCASSCERSVPDSLKKETRSSKPPAVVELSPTKTKHSEKPSVIADIPQRMIKHAKSADDTTSRESRCGSEQKRRSRSTGPSREKVYPHGTCNKCDGCHLSADCPTYHKEREKHKDSWRYYSYSDDKKKKQMGSDGGNKRVKANRIKQPADGSCLFHALVYCFNSMKDGKIISSSASISSSSSTVSQCVPPPLTAKYLRKKIASYVAANPNLPIADDPLKEWVLWDSGQSVRDYAAAMAVSGWGGGIEIAACSHLYKVNIHVYEADPKSNEYVRISCFNFDSLKTKKTLHILYHGRNHYDALQLK